MTVDEIQTPRPWGSGNPALWKLKYEVDDERFLQIFRDFAALIRRSEKACEAAVRQDNPDYEDFVSEIESDYIEELIGSSFIVLQAKIRRVVASAKALHDQLLTYHRVDVPELGKEHILKLPGRYKRKRASLIELIWDVGNYYKHRDEWSWDVWRAESGNKKKDGPLKQARQTRRSVERVGITVGSTGNMRNAYEFFDINPYSNCEALAQKVQEWAKEVYTLAQTKLRAEVHSRPAKVKPSKP